MFEISNPSNPGTVSNMLAGISFIVAAGLIVYGFSVVKKFKQI
ncbi:MAG TPA: hypothetical protein QF698_09950 [Candidatus Marinimicrobia bacterium]|jgi:hypothetical protein|nr:hypothetical protein [Candidatus Neomarinimicrobiota bacterium]